MYSCKYCVKFEAKMKFAYYIKKSGLGANPELDKLFAALKGAGVLLYPANSSSDIQQGTDALLSLGGDGTFLSAARIAVSSGLPILGVNFGRLGFLSEVKPEELASAIDNVEFQIEERDLLQVKPSIEMPYTFWPYALNEMTVSRVGASMLGIDLSVNGSALPTYWADGLLVATGSGSTAYSLSVGGPICTPDSKLFIVSPVSPHNLNVRPLIVPLDSELSLSMRSREENVVFTMDNQNFTVPAGTSFELCSASLRLKKMTLGNSNFINALRSRLLWGQDVRNGSDSY